MRDYGRFVLSDLFRKSASYYTFLIRSQPVFIDDIPDGHRLVFSSSCDILGI